MHDNKTAVLSFGRMNPPTVGHLKLVNKIMSVTGDHYVFLSHSHNHNNNPLPFSIKLQYAKMFFPDVIVGDYQVKTVIQALQKLYQQGYKNIVYVAGSDRVEDFTQLLHQYNGITDKAGNMLYEFKSITILNAGVRDADADDTSGMSASKMRQYAVDNDLESFSHGVPVLKMAERMFNDVCQFLTVPVREVSISTCHNA